MAFYSILFPAQEDEARARAHPWLTFREDGKKAKGMPFAATRSPWRRKEANRMPPCARGSIWT